MTDLAGKNKASFGVKTRKWEKKVFKSFKEADKWVKEHSTYETYFSKLDTPPNQTVYYRKG